MLRRIKLADFSKVFIRFLKETNKRKLSYTSEKIKLNMGQTSKSRENPAILKLDSTEFKSIFTEEVCELKRIFDKYGFEIRLAGGPVRDLLMGIQPKDLDFATIATPQQMKDMFTDEEVRMINMNGEKHGTITPRINDKENFEVTTLRIDVVTDGRRAEVQFTSDWRLDSNRRDLTINSMFLGFDGTVYDYFYGYEDLMAKRIVFVGDADTRIKEDYLRILRYFRFYGRIAKDSESHDNNNLISIKNNTAGLEAISGERIWMELKKILSGNFAGDLLELMIELGMGKYMGLPEDPDIIELNKIWKDSRHHGLHPITLLASILKDIDDVVALNNRLKFSTYDRDLAYFIVEHREYKISDNPLLPYQKLLLNSKMKQSIAREYIVEVLKYRNDSKLLEQFNNWELPKFFHISVPMMNEKGATSPKLYSYIINELKNHWADHNFDLSIEEIVEQIPTIIADAPDILKNPKRKKN